MNSLTDHASHPHLLNPHWLYHSEWYSSFFLFFFRTSCTFWSGLLYTSSVPLQKEKTIPQTKSYSFSFPLRIIFPINHILLPLITQRTHTIVYCTPESQDSLAGGEGNKKNDHNWILWYIRMGMMIAWSDEEDHMWLEIIKIVGKSWRRSVKDNLTIELKCRGMCDNRTSEYSLTIKVTKGRREEIIIIVKIVKYILWTDPSSDKRIFLSPHL